MLLSTCPNCGAQFRVTPQQLNVRQGRVMCGRCRHVFNAFESLKRREGDGDSEIVDFSVVDSGRSGGSEIVAGDSAHPQEGNHDVALSEIATEHLGAPVKLPEAAVDESSETPEGSRTMIVGSFGPHRNVAQEIDHPFDAGNTPEEKSSDVSLTTAYDAVDLASDGSAPSGANIERFRLTGGENPLIAGTKRFERNPGSSRIWSWLACLTFILFGIQGLYFFRSEIVQQYPQIRPYFVYACGVATCTIPWGRDQTAIKIESSDLIEPPGKPGRILLTALIVNRAKTRHDFPSIEVKLMDTGNTVLASRILSPSEYLGRVPSHEENIPPNGELYVNLNLELIGKVPASGYGLRAFYP